MTIKDKVSLYLQGREDILGGFYTGLVEAALKADLDNLEKIKEGFPQVVEAIKEYRSR